MTKDRSTYKELKNMTSKDQAKRLVEYYIGQQTTSIEGASDEEAISICSHYDSVDCVCKMHPSSYSSDLITCGSNPDWIRISTACPYYTQRK